MINKQTPPGALLKNIRALVVDDEDLLAWSIDTELTSLGAEILRAGSVREALERLPGFAPDLVITDLRLPDGNGLELMKKWRMERPEMPIILITAHGAIDSAITALRLGAFDYLQKPFDMKDLIAAVHRAAEAAKLRQKVSSLAGYEVRVPDVEIIGQSPAMQELRDQLLRLARSKANTALILGDSGTGKELAARAIHQWSERRAQPFVEINCASIPEALLESELFGYEKGAFTDARERKLGLFEVARGGSILLDELGEMPAKMQAKLLRVLEYRRFKRLGGTKDLEFAGRIIAATNRNLIAEVEAGRFRADLYYRLSALPVQLPLLRDRLGDLGQLTQFFLAQLSTELAIKTPTISAPALAYLRQHSWPGNVRELKNVLQRALVFHEPEILEPIHIKIDTLRPTTPATLAGSMAPSYDALAAPSAVGLDKGVVASVHLPEDAPEELPRAWLPDPISPQAPPPPGPLAVIHSSLPGEYHLPTAGINLEDLERSLLQQALERARNNQTRAAQLLGITRHTLRYRLEKHGLAEQLSN